MEAVIQLLPFIFLIAVMYFVIIRPQQKEVKAREAMVAALQKGDKVVTNGGLIVTINKVEENFFSVKFNSDVIGQITKESVVRKYDDA